MTRDRTTRSFDDVLRIAGFVAVLSACGGHSSAPATSPSPDASAEERAIAKASADSARYPYTAADIHFMTGMIGHHAQAIVMARWAPTPRREPVGAALASRIINAQTDEIVDHAAWLRDRRQPVPEAKSAGDEDDDERHGARHAHAGHAHRSDR